MALTPLLLEEVMKRLTPGKAVVSMGYPDITASRAWLRERLGEKILALKWREDAESICKRHGIPQQDIVDSESLFGCFDCSLDVFDIVQERGTEIVLDLNYPVPENAVGQFDFCLDVGTTEHCFNAPQALVNMASVVKVGGVVMHENPFNWGNHGFWNLNPTLFEDFYTANGFEVESIWLVPRGKDEAYEAPRTKRFVYTQGEANLITIARKVEKVPLTYPTQTKYKKNG
jgi:SAM-dependent methyltransferase